MKKYALFGGEFYYPTGGMGDLVATLDVADELETLATDPSTRDQYGGIIQWWHIADMTTGAIVKKWRWSNDG